MGNQQSNYPERMLKLKNIQELNDDIDDFNTKQLNQKAMDALGFLIQFEEINHGGIKGILKKLFFQQALTKIEINTNMVRLINNDELLDNKPYYFKLKVIEMYNLAELLSRYTEDIESDQHEQNNQQQIQQLSQIVIGRKKSSEPIKNQTNQGQQQQQEYEENKQQDDQNMKQNKQDQYITEDEDKICPLCLDARIQVILPCYHGYCDNCARNWIQEKQQKNCPMCRFQVESTQSKFNRTVMHIEDDMNIVNQQVKQQIIAIILSKNDQIPFIGPNK